MAQVKSLHVNKALQAKAKEADEANAKLSKRLADTHAKLEATERTLAEVKEAGKLQQKSSAEATAMASNQSKELKKRQDAVAKLEEKCASLTEALAAANHARETLEREKAEAEGRAKNATSSATASAQAELQARMTLLLALN